MFDPAKRLGKIDKQEKLNNRKIKPHVWWFTGAGIALLAGIVNATTIENPGSGGFSLVLGQAIAFLSVPSILAINGILSYKSKKTYFWVMLITYLVIALLITTYTEFKI